MEDVLFRNFKIIENDSKAKEDIRALECACYLTIDQTNNKGETSLEYLQEYGVEGIPSSLEELNIETGVNDHRSATHRGWDFNYIGKNAEKWPIRQRIMLNTVDTVFDFDGNVDKQESFCELLYYVHILGDHLSDEKIQHTNNSNGLKMGVGGRHDDQNIIDYLIDNIEVLFKDQKHTHKYTHLVANLEERNARFSEIVNSEGGISTQEDFDLYKKYTDEVKELLTLYVPEMLKEEQFFYEVFYE